MVAAMPMRAKLPVGSPRPKIILRPSENRAPVAHPANIDGVRSPAIPPPLLEEVLAADLNTANPAHTRMMYLGVSPSPFFEKIIIGKRVYVPVH